MAIRSIGDVEDRSTVEHPLTGEELPLDEIEFVSLEGNRLAIHLPKRLQWFKGPDGTQRAREIGDEVVEFDAGLYPPPGQTIDYETALLMLEHKHFADHPDGDDVYTLAAQEQDVEPSGGVPPDESEFDVGEDEVILNGEVVSKEEALERLQNGASEEPESEMPATPEESSQSPPEVQDGPDESDLVVLEEPQNRTEALEALAERGVDLSDAPPASATTSEIVDFAYKHGFIIDKYGPPDPLAAPDES